tara:strand:+ start:81 stop:806 length:726 start_codon:yes stop_codon:yes gene_type:complete
MIYRRGTYAQNNATSPIIPPIQSGLICDFNFNDSSSYDWFTSTSAVTSLTGTNNGVISGTVVNSDLTTPVGAVNVFGTDTNGDKSLYCYGSGSSNNIRVNTTVNLTNWSASFRIKHRANIGAGYDRMFGTRNYRMELVLNYYSQIWYYQSGWVNTGISIPNDGQFHSVDWTYQNSPRQFKIYLDGVLVYSTTAKGTTLVSSSYYWVMGSQDSRNTIQQVNRHLLYNRTLTQAEVVANLNIY